jgi:hypothetical protein
MKWISRNQVLASALLLASCASSSQDGGSGDAPWINPSPILEEQIANHAGRLPWAHGMERIELIRWFAAVGEPAYGTLLDLARSEQAEVAGSALAALGATGDSRLVPHVQAIQYGEEIPLLQLERARTLMRLGDWSGAPVLIAGLRNEELFTRAMCGRTLEDATGEKLGFDPRAEEPERNASAARWESWWQARQAEGLLGTSRTTP